MQGGHRTDYRVALVVPLQGPAGMYGPSCELCAQLAVDQLNRGSGLLGREVRLVVVDGAAPPPHVAAEVDDLVSAGAVDAVVGWHISAVREVLVPAIAQRVPYVFTALYEGGEHAPGVFLTGETPEAQTVPALRWMSEELSVRRWTIVGNDYSWPVGSARTIRRHAEATGATIVDEVYVPLGHDEFEPVLDRIERADGDGVLMFLVGSDAVRFNRAFASAGLHHRFRRLTPLMDENMLLGSGADAAQGLYTAAGYFEALPTQESLEFNGDFARRFGPDAPVLNANGESCYEGIALLAALAERADDTGISPICRAADDVSYHGPRGAITVHDGHVRQRVYLATPSGHDYEILALLDPA